MSSLIKEGSSKPSITSKNKSYKITELFKLEKCAAELRKIKVSKELKLNDVIDKLATTFCSYNAPDFNKFAQEAYTLHGVSAMPLLKNIANVIREDITFTKQAEESINDITQEHIQFKEAQTELMDYIKVATQLQDMERKIKDQWDTVLEISRKAAV
jgi:hypothetical protein